MPNYTSRFALAKPLVDSAADEGQWGDQINANFDLLDSLVGQALLRRSPVYQWTDGYDESMWDSYTATVAQVGDNLRFTNTTAENNDAAIWVYVPAGKSVVVRANMVANSGAPAPTMHLGSATESYGGIGLDYPVNQDIAVTAPADGELVIYMNTNATAVDAYAEFSEISVSVIESGAKLTVAEVAPTNPSVHDLWLDISTEGTVVPNLLPTEYISFGDGGWQHVDVGGVTVAAEPVADESGGTNAKRITFVGVDNNHVWLEADGGMPVLEVGASYTIRAWFRSDDYTGQIELGYYNGSAADGDAEYAFTGDGTWQELEHIFTVTLDATDPRLRLIGWGNGADGASLDIGRVRLERNV